MIEPPPGYGLVTSTKLTPFNNSQMIEDYLEILLDDGAKVELLMHVPQSDDMESAFITKSRQQITYHFNTEKGVKLNGGTALTTTAFKEASKGCGDDHFLCSNAQCIWKNFTCDGFNNCGDNSDESRTANAYCVYLEDYCPPNYQQQFVTISLGYRNANSSSILKASRTSNFLYQRDCMITLQPSFGYGVILSIRQLNFTPITTPCENYVQISETPYCEYIDDTTESKSFSTMGPMQLTFFTQINVYQEHSDITFTVTSFPLYMYDCSKEKFQCQNSRCIWEGFVCDGHNNCGDRSDEVSNGKAKCGKLSPGTIIAIVLGTLAVVFLIGISVFLYRKSKQHKDEENKSILSSTGQSYGSGEETSSSNTNAKSNT